MNKMKIKNSIHGEDGLVSIIVVSIVTVILAITTIGFSKIMDRELKQSIDRELAIQAHYAVESGINDSRVYVAKTLEGGGDPSTGGGCLDPASPPFAVSPNPFVKTISGSYTVDPQNFTKQQQDPTVQYSCVIIDSQPRQLVWDVPAGESQVFKMTGSSISKMFFSFENKNPLDDATKTVDFQPMPGADTSTYRIPKESEYTNVFQTGMLRVTIYPIPGGLPSNPDSALAGAARTYFLYPNGKNGSNEDFPSRGEVGTASYNDNGVYIDGNCNKSNRDSADYLPYSQARAYYCNTAVDGLSASTYFVRLTALYRTLSVGIQASGGGGSVAIGEAQAVIDVTGEGNDVLKRQVVHVPYANNYNYPAYELQSMGTVCKRFGLPKIGPGSNDYGPAVTDPSVANDPNCAIAAAYTPLSDTLSCNSFSASNNPIQKGQSTTLSWTFSGDPRSFRINGTEVYPATSYTVSPPNTTTYTLVITGADGSTATCPPVTVSVTPPAVNCPNSRDFHEDYDYAGPPGGIGITNIVRFNVTAADPGCSYQIRVTAIDETHDDLCERPVGLCRQRFEQLFVEGYNNDGTLVFRTGLTPDIPNEDEEITERFTIIVGNNKQLNYILVKHISIHPDPAIRNASFQDAYNSVHEIRVKLQKD